MYSQIEASESAHPGNIRDGSCDTFGNCRPGYPVHCQNCFELCATKQEKSGIYKTAVITLSTFENKQLQKNKREKVTCGNLKSTRRNSVDRELISAAKDPSLLK